MIFPKGIVGVFIAKMKEWEASFGVPWYTSASRPFKGMTSIGVPWYTNASSILTRFVSTSSAFFFVCVSFFDFWTDFRAAVWRHFQALFSSNFICMESYRCLVSNGSSLVWFGATVVEILSSEQRWPKVEKFLMSSLEKFISSSLKLISLNPFGEN